MSLIFQIGENAAGSPLHCDDVVLTDDQLNADLAISDPSPSRKVSAKHGLGGNGLEESAFDYCYAAAMNLEFNGEL